MILVSRVDALRLGGCDCFFKVGGADVDSGLSHDGRVSCINRRERMRYDTADNHAKK